MEPRDYQMDAFIKGVRERRSLLLSPTGSGKSFIIYLLTRYYAKRTLIIVPTVNLVNQLSSDFDDYGFNSDTMKFVLDSSKYKQGKITPVTRIPIVGDEAVVDIKDGLGILLAWNIGSDLKSKLLSMNSNLNFLDSL